MPDYRAELERLVGAVVLLGTRVSEGHNDAWQPLSTQMEKARAALNQSESWPDGEGWVEVFPANGLSFVAQRVDDWELSEILRQVHVALMLGEVDLVLGWLSEVPACPRGPSEHEGK